MANPPASTPSPSHPALAAWKRHHRDCAQRSLYHLRRYPLQSLLTASVMAIALLLPAALWVCLHNLEHLGQHWDARPKLMLYLKPQAEDTAIETLKNHLQNRPGLADVLVFTPQQALDSLNSLTSLGDALSGLDHNPLPTTLIIQQSPGVVGMQTLQALAKEMQTHPLVDLAELDQAWLITLNHAIALGQTFAQGLAALLGVGLLIVVGNTLRLDIENKRDEIRVLKLLGATNAFIRRPFLYLGGYYGLMGGLLACIALALCLAYLRQASQPLAEAYPTLQILQGLGFSGSLLLLVISTGLGLLGAFVAVGRHLGHIQPK